MHVIYTFIAVLGDIYANDIYTFSAVLSNIYAWDIYLQCSFK
jgi:hypothetical protein